MGKEVEGSKRLHRLGDRRGPTRRIDAPELPIEKLWGAATTFTSQSQIIEDGYASVTISTGKSSACRIYTKLRHANNRYPQLLHALQRRGHISANIHSVLFFKHGDFGWAQANPAIDSFNSGDRLRLLVQEVPKHRTKKIWPPRSRDLPSRKCRHSALYSCA